MTVPVRRLLRRTLRDPRRMIPIALLASGLGLILAAPDSLFSFRTNPLLTGVGVGYSLAGLLFGILRIRGGQHALEFRIGLGFALVSVAIVIGVWIVALGQYRIDPFAISWWIDTVSYSPAVTVPIVGALLLPLGTVRNEREWTIGTALFLAPAFLGVVGIVLNPSAGFGPSFMALMICAQYLGGTVVGIPLWLSAKAFSRDSREDRSFRF